MFRWLTIPLVLAVAAGCATTQPAPTQLLSPKAEDGRGRIVVRTLHVRDSLLRVLLLGTTGTTAFKASLYDVTDKEPSFLGPMESRGMIHQQPLQDLVEYDTPPGKRTLMLYMRGFFGDDHVDFVEVQVRPNEFEQIAITQYGANDRPRFVQLDFDQRATRHCGYTKDLDFAQAKAFFEASKLPQSVDLVRYCADLSSNSYVRPVTTSWTSPLSRERVSALKGQYLPIWQAMPEKEPPTDPRPAAAGTR